MLIVIIEKQIMTADHQNIGDHYIDINMMYITTFWLYTNSLHLERSSTAHAA